MTTFALNSAVHKSEVGSVNMLHRVREPGASCRAEIAARELLPEVRYLGLGDWELPDGAEVHQSSGDESYDREWVLVMPDGKEWSLVTHEPQRERRVGFTCRMGAICGDHGSIHAEVEDTEHENQHIPGVAPLWDFNPKRRMFIEKEWTWPEVDGAGVDDADSVSVVGSLDDAVDQAFDWIKRQLRECRERKRPPRLR